jgi:hypothetical protein
MIAVSGGHPGHAPSKPIDFIELLDVPAAAALVCARAYAAYRRRRTAESGKDSPRTPLPDFFVGAHAEIMDWCVATADPQRFTTYFPSVDLATP